MDLIQRFGSFPFYVWAAYGSIIFGAALLSLKIQRDLKAKTVELKKLEAALKLQSRPRHEA